MAQFGDEPDIQVVHARGTIKDHAPPSWRAGNKVGVAQDLIDQTEDIEVDALAASLPDDEVDVVIAYKEASHE